MPDNKMNMTQVIDDFNNTYSEQNTKVKMDKLLENLGKMTKKQKYELDRHDPVIMQAITEIKGKYALYSFVF